MKVTKLVIGIISIVLFVFISFQSCVGGFSNILTARNALISAGFQFGLAVMMLAAGIVGIVASNTGRGKTSTAASVLYIIGGIIGVIGFAASNVFNDLIIWTILSFVFAIVFYMGSYTKNQTEVSNTDGKLCQGDVFVFDNYEIFFGFTEYSYTEKIEDTVIHFPIEIVNKDYKEREFDYSCLKIYTPNGTEAKIINGPYGDDFEDIGNLFSGAMRRAYIRVLYEGDGDYHAEFAKVGEVVQVVRLPTKR